ncbi:MAG: hypothetical protein H6853_08830 [Rhodospirillales bacterium]|nr:hypothetical protein [Alphaproteobacteria bacterium]USO03610.1 MAG: hypothetical protein H6853_08830 [Rhodospirillales bacterium]
MTGQDKLEGFKCPKEELLKLWDMKTDLLNATAEEKAEATLATIAVENNVFALIPVFEPLKEGLPPNFDQSILQTHLSKLQLFAKAPFGPCIEGHSIAKSLVRKALVTFSVRYADVFRQNNLTFTL